MTAGVDRRTFLTRAAAAGGGLLSIGAVERLVARDALARAHRGGAQPYGRLRRVADQRGIEVLALPAGFSYVTFSHSGSTMSDGNPTPLALDGMGAFAGRRHRGHGHRGHDHLVRLVRNSEDRNPAGTPGSVLGDRSAAYDPTAFGGTTTLVFDEHRRRLAAGLRQPQRHDRELRRRDRLPAPLLAHRRGDRRRAGRGRPRRPLREAPRLPVPDARRPRAERARGRRADRRRRPVLARGGGRRPAHGHRLRDRGPRLGRRRRLLPLHAGRPQRPGRRRAAGDARHRRAAAGRPARGAQARRGAAGAVGDDRRARPVADGRRRPSQHVQPGLGEGRREVQPARGLLGGGQHDLLRVHERRRRQERGRQLRRLRRGLRPGVGLPPGRVAAGRSRSSTSRRPGAPWIPPTT